MYAKPFSCTHLYVQSFVNIQFGVICPPYIYQLSPLKVLLHFHIVYIYCLGIRIGMQLSLYKHDGQHSVNVQKIMYKNKIEQEIYLQRNSISLALPPSICYFNFESTLHSIVGF